MFFNSHMYQSNQQLYYIYYDMLSGSSLYVNGFIKKKKSSGDKINTLQHYNIHNIVKSIENLYYIHQQKRKVPNMELINEINNSVELGIELFYI